MMIPYSLRMVVRIGIVARDNVRWVGMTVERGRWIVDLLADLRYDWVHFCVSYLWRGSWGGRIEVNGAVK